MIFNQAKDDQLRKALETALDLGYRLIDTAMVYMNEKIVGEVLNARFDAGKLKREDIFITSKASHKIDIERHYKLFENGHI